MPLCRCRADPALLGSALLAYAFSSRLVVLMFSEKKHRLFFQLLLGMLRQLLDPLGPLGRLRSSFGQFNNDNVLQQYILLVRVAWSPLESEGLCCLAGTALDCYHH